MTELIAPIGVHLALLLPYFVFSLVSPDAIRESKLAAQAFFAALVLIGLASDVWREKSENRHRLPTPLLVLAGATLAFVVASALRGAFDRTEPLVLVPIGAACALFLAGASRRGEAISARALPLLALAGAVTSLLALLQRTLGLFVLPIDAQGSRYRAAGLIGSPGDVGAALVIPAILLGAVLMDPAKASRTRIVAGAGLSAVLLGLAATEALTPIGAVSAGFVAFAFFDVRRRWPGLAGLALLGMAALVVTGASGRLEKVIRLLRRDSVAAAVSERDIGVRAGLEMIREAPLLGEGPGNFSSGFVQARLRAEERLGRRLTHSSTSAHFENAHNEALTFAAECGVPALLFGSGAALLGLYLLARQRSDLLFALLLSLGVLGLASFPSRLAVVAGPCAFLLGLSARAVGVEEPDSRSGRWRLRSALLLLGGLLLAAGAVTRWVATVRLAEGENALRAAVETSPSDRSPLLDIARNRLQEAIRLRPRFSPSWIALGSTYRIDRNLEAARASFWTAFVLEERAETDLNLGRIELVTGHQPAGFAWSLRAVWILPRLAESLPPSIEAPALGAEIARLEAALSSGGKAPPIPSSPRSPHL